MVTERIQIQAADPQTDALKKAIDIIGAGGLVAFPTETVYGIACRVSQAALTRLDKVKQRARDKRYTLHIGDKTHLTRFLPRTSLMAGKLARIAWPGPLTLIFDVPPETYANAAEQESMSLLTDHQSTLGVRCPDHAVAAALLTGCPWAVVAPSANKSGQSPAVNGEQVAEALGDNIDLILDAGPCPIQQSSTVARVRAQGVHVLREGAVSTAALKQWARIQILFVCSGNTCRSPMAEALCRQLLAQRLLVKDIDGLSEMGYKVTSAGTMGLSDAPASAGAIEACAHWGTDLSGHRSRALTVSLVRESDLIFAMERSHVDMILNLCPDAKEYCMPLDEQADIPDPVGQPLAVFQQCAVRIERAIEKRIGEWVL